MNATSISVKMCLIMIFRVETLTKDVCEALRFCYVYLSALVQASCVWNCIHVFSKELKKSLFGTDETNTS